MLERVNAFSVMLLVSCSSSASVSTAMSELTVGDPCPTLGCGVNGAWVGENIEFHDLDWTGSQQNDAGLKIKGVRGPQGDAIQVHVDKHDLVGTRGNGTRLKRGELKNTKFFLARTHNHTIDEYELTITSVQCTSFWTEATQAWKSCDQVPDRAPLYKIRFNKVGDPKDASLCGPDIQDDASIAGFAVIYTGERYHEDRKFGIRETVAGDTWFNIACAKTALAKLHLLRHTLASRPASGANTYDTTLGQRQAMLRLLVGDYCGSGTSFTRNNLPLMYPFRQTWTQPFDPAKVRSLDAFWSEDGTGATCIEEPRLERARPRIGDKIKRECKRVNRVLEPCSKKFPPTRQPIRSWIGTYWPPNAYAVSANPRPAR